MEERFKIPTDAETSGMAQSLVAKATKKKTESDMNTFRAYVSAMQHPTLVDEFTPNELKDVMSMMKFVISARKTDGETAWSTSHRHCKVCGTV